MGRTLPRTAAFDTEGHAVSLGRGCDLPRLVCGSLSRQSDTSAEGALLQRKDTLDYLEAFLRSNLSGGAPEDDPVFGGPLPEVLVFHSMPFDVGVCCEERNDLILRAFQAVEKGLFSDIMIREKLIRLAKGTMSFDRSLGERGEVPGFSLAKIVRYRFQVDLTSDKTDPDAWRLRYNELDGVPLSLWPQKAKDYAIDDARWTLLVWHDQAREARSINYEDPERPGFVVNEVRQLQSYWALRLASAWGVRTDADAVAEVEDRLREAVAGLEEVLVEAKLCNWKTKDGVPTMSVNRRRVQNLVARAYARLALSEYEDDEISPEVRKSLEEDLDRMGEPAPDYRGEIRAATTKAKEDHKGALSEEWEPRIYQANEEAKAARKEARRIATLVKKGEARKAEAESALEVVHKAEAALHDLKEGYKEAKRTPPAFKPPEVPIHMGRFVDPGPADSEEEAASRGWHWRLDPIEAVYNGKAKRGGGGTSVVLVNHDLRFLRAPAPLTDPSDTFPRGQVSYASEVFEVSRDPTLEVMAEQSSSKKLLETYIPILWSASEYPVNCSWNPLVETGRVSCFNPNLQNQPTFGGVRECFVPRPGFVYLFSDLKTAECRAFAQWSWERFGVSRMGDAIRLGRDPYLDAALDLPDLRGASYEEVSRALEGGDKLVKRCRKTSKVTVLGRLGGMGHNSLPDYAHGFGVEMTLPEAKACIKAVDGRYEELPLHFAWINDKLGGGDSFTFVQPLSGRRRAGCSYTVGCNQGFQGRIADQMKETLFEISRECYTDPTSPLFGSRLVVFVHDEVILEVPDVGTKIEIPSFLSNDRPRTLSESFLPTPGPRFKDEGYIPIFQTKKRRHDAAMRVRDIMIRVGGTWLPDIPTDTDPGFARRWYKNRSKGIEVEQVFDSDGLLDLYEPRAA